MLEVRNEIVSDLYKSLNVPVIPSHNTRNRPDYPYIDYTILANITDKSEGIYSYDSNSETSKIELQPSMSISFGVYSGNHDECYKLAGKLYDLMKFQIEPKTYVIKDVLDVEDRTVLEVNEYEYHYGLDVLVRYKYEIGKDQDYIESYTVDGEVNKE